MTMMTVDTLTERRICLASSHYPESVSCLIWQNASVFLSWSACRSVKIYYQNTTGRKVPFRKCYKNWAGRIQLGTRRKVNVSSDRSTVCARGRHSRTTIVP